MGSPQLCCGFVRRIIIGRPPCLPFSFAAGVEPCRLRTNSHNKSAGHRACPDYVPGRCPHLPGFLWYSTAWDLLKKLQNGVIASGATRREARKRSAAISTLLPVRGLRSPRLAREARPRLAMTVMRVSQHAPCRGSTRRITFSRPPCLPDAFGFVDTMNMRLALRVKP
jgi:hypothetical protein